MFKFGARALLMASNTVAAPRTGQGVPRNTLTWKKLKKKNLYLIHIRNTLNHKIRNTLNHKIRNTLKLKKKNICSTFKPKKKKKKKKKPQKKIWTKIFKKKKKLVTKPSLLPTASQAQHNTEVANPWILTQKKKKKTSIEQIRNQSTVTSLAEKTKYNLYKAKANQTPLPNTTIQICLSKKKKPNTKKTKPQTQSKPNPRWDGHIARRRNSLRCSSSSSSRRCSSTPHHHSFAPRRRSSRGPRHRSS